MTAQPRDGLALFSLAGKVALVTGAARGLGFEMAKAMAAAGATVVLNGRDAGSLAARRSEIADGAADIAAFDVADHNASAHAIADIEARHGGIDILVNNVGLRERRTLWDVDLDAVRRLLEVDLVAPLELGRLVGRGMIDRGRGGAIINLTSIAGRGASTDPVYGVAKAGLAALTRSLAVMLGPSGVRVNAIAPGLFSTEYNAQVIDTIGEAIAERTMLGRLGRPEDIAGLAVFLASDASAYLTGQEIVIDGGLSLFH